MKYNITVLEKMVENYTANIKMFQSYINSQKDNDASDIEKRIANMIGSRRLIAAMIDNNGESVVPSRFRNEGVFFDSTLYEACASGDTSWW